MKKLFTLIAAFFITYASFAQFPIMGTLGVCEGSSTGLYDSSTGGTWSSSNTAVGTVSSMGTSVTVTGISVGTTVITYSLGGSSYVTAVFTVNPTPAAISGPSSVCIGSTITLSDATAGGYWTTSYSGYASVGSGTGVVTGVGTGTADIYYYDGAGCFVYKAISVGGAGTVAAITGASFICIGASSTLADATSGGVWSSSSTAIATVVSTTGVVTGISAGVVDISYTITGACGPVSAVKSVTIGVTSTTVPAISGLSTICLGSSATLTDSLAGGTWSSSNPAIATVTSGGVVTGVSGGTVDITYMVTGTCGGTAYAVKAVTISTTSSAGTISGTSTVYIGGTTSLYDGVPDGTWSSSSPSIATIGAYSGVVTGVAAGTATITYSDTSGCGGYAYTTYVVTVSAFTGISGHVVFSGGYSGNVKVWLITYNSSTSDLEAYDSTVVTCTGDSVYYQFPVEPTDSYRVKASVNEYDSLLSTGYIPTYHTSSFYWYDANVINHTSGTANTNEDIDMAVGTVTSGTGFISGNVTTGANRGTSTSVPVVGLLMVAETSAGNVIQQTVTDASGNYTFNYLTTGTYTVHPELINYRSVDYTSILLTTAAPSKTAANFIQHTNSHTITPGTEGLANVNPVTSSVFAFPNPTNGKLNIEWQETATENTTITIADITGREVYKTTMNMTQGSGANQLDLSGLTNGLYILSVNSGTINYNNKIQVQH